jgi:transposase
LRKVNNRAGQIFRLAAQSLHRSSTPMGEYLRRLKGKLDPAGAITATARKIATLFYTLVTRQVEFDHTLRHATDTERQQRIQARLTRQARRLGYQLVPLQVSSSM